MYFVCNNLGIDLSLHVKKYKDNIKLNYIKMTLNQWLESVKGGGGGSGGGGGGGGNNDQGTLVCIGGRADGWGIFRHENDAFGGWG